MPSAARATVGDFVVINASRGFGPAPWQIVALEDHDELVLLRHEAGRPITERIYRAHCHVTHETVRASLAHRETKKRRVVDAILSRPRRRR